MPKPKQNVTWTEDLMNEVISLRLSGESVDNIARKTGISAGYIYSFLKKKNMTSKALVKPKYSPKVGRYAKLK
jgi:transposase